MPGSPTRKKKSLFQNVVQTINVDKLQDNIRPHCLSLYGGKNIILCWYRFWIT